jgi:hypothetical protein
MLRTSTNAKTWGSEVMASAGALGDYGPADRVSSLRLERKSSGYRRSHVTDPIPWRISGAEIDGSGFAQTQAQA